MSVSLPPLQDQALPQLEALQDPVLMGAVLERAIYAAPVTVTEIAIVRHKPGRRCILRYELRLGPPMRQRSERLYAKTFASDRGPRVYETIRAIAAARACGPNVRLPDPIGYLPSLKLLLQREAPGEPLVPALLGGDQQLASQVAGAVYALHTSRLELPRRHGIGEELSPLAGRVERLSAASPALAGIAQRCLALAQDGAQVAKPWRWRPIHRDFYHDQVLLGEHGLSMLDFDDAKMSEPAVDVANFLAHLRLLSLQQTGTVGALSGVADAFEGRYRRLDTDLDPALTRFLEGTTLLRLAEIHLPRHSEVRSRPGEPGVGATETRPPNSKVWSRLSESEVSATETRPPNRGEWLAAQLLAESDRLLTLSNPPHTAALGG